MVPTKKSAKKGATRTKRPVRSGAESPPNFANQTIWTGDNLDIMRGMNSACVDLIYLDPPFNSKANYAAPIGSKAAGAAFKDTWGLEDIDLAWHGEISKENPGLYALLTTTQRIQGDSMMSYLIYMAIRFMEMKRLLKPTGTIWLHCNQEAGHYLKLLMDAIFGHKNLISEVIWAYGTPSGGRTSGKKPVKVHDNLYAYANNYSSHLYNIQYTPYSKHYIKEWFRHVDDSSGKNRYYRTRSRNGKIIRQYLDESPGVPLSTVWSDIMQLYGSKGWFKAGKHDERTGYPTQKPVALLQRIISASSNEEDLVLDPFCGCATTCIAAQHLNRRWVGVDISPTAVRLVEDRMNTELGYIFEGERRSDIPERTDLGPIPPYNNIENINYLYGEQGGFCNGCQEHFLKQNLTVDHIIPKGKGETGRSKDHISNLQLLCGRCNSVKGDRPMEYLLSKLHEEGSLKRSDFRGDMTMTFLTDKSWVKRRKSDDS